MWNLKWPIDNGCSLAVSGGINRPPMQRSPCFVARSSLGYPSKTPRPAVLAAIYKVVGHVEMHMGQIILLTKHYAAQDLDLTIPRPR